MLGIHNSFHRIISFVSQYYRFILSNSCLLHRRQVCPAGSAYEGGIFPIQFQLPSNYPFGMPAVKFERQIYHPNISSDGGININWLVDSWTAGQTVSIGTS